jgi:hypothetical protein
MWSKVPTSGLISSPLLSATLSTNSLSLDLLATPARPINDCLVVKLVNVDIDAVASQRPGQREHSLTVFG